MGYVGEPRLFGLLGSSDRYSCDRCGVTIQDSYRLSRWASFCAACFRRPVGSYLVEDAFERFVTRGSPGPDFCWLCGITVDRVTAAFTCPKCIHPDRSHTPASFNELGSREDQRDWLFFSCITCGVLIVRRVEGGRRYKLYYEVGNIAPITQPRSCVTVPRPASAACQHAWLDIHDRQFGPATDRDIRNHWRNYPMRKLMGDFDWWGLEPSRSATCYRYRWCRLCGQLHFARFF
jgi:hypothetical protein